LTTHLGPTAYLLFLLGLVTLPSPGLSNPGAAVALVWDPSTDATVTGYNVYYGAGSRSYTNVVPAGTSTNAVVSNLLS